ncbi:MAG: SxtJ family membrane protein [Planctomycetota bacterium]
MSLVKIDWRPDRAGYRKFGVAVFVGFTIIGALVWLFGGSLAATREAGRLVWGPLPWFTIPTAAILALSIVAPRACRPFYIAWMAIAFVMGTVISNLLLAVIYWILFGGIAALFRLRGRDGLLLKKPAAGSSTWTTTSDASSRERYQRQF